MAKFPCLEHDDVSHAVVLHADHLGLHTQSLPGIRKRGEIIDIGGKLAVVLHDGRNGKSPAILGSSKAVLNGCALVDATEVQVLTLQSQGFIIRYPLGPKDCVPSTPTPTNLLIDDNRGLLVGDNTALLIRD